MNNRLVPFELGGRTMKLNCSVAAMCDIQQGYGSMNNVMHHLNQLINEDTFNGIAFAADMIAKLAQQGKKYCDLTGEQCAAPWDAEEIKVLVPATKEGIRLLSDKLREALQIGAEPTVTVGESKNVKTTPESLEKD